MDEGWWVVLSRPVSVESAEEIARHLKVIGQPVRVRLIETLDRAGEASVGQLAAAVGVSITDASQHLKILREGGIVARRQNGRHGVYQLVAPARVLKIYDLVAADLHTRAERPPELL